MSGKMRWRKKAGAAILLTILFIISSASASADFNNDFVVDFKDLAMFINYWLYDYNDNARCASWDLAENGIIDFNDLAVITGQWLTDYNFLDFSNFAAYWQRTVDYRYLDRRFDLAGGAGGSGLRASSSDSSGGDGVVNFSDFSARQMAGLEALPVQAAAISVFAGATPDKKAGAACPAGQFAEISTGKISNGQEIKDITLPAGADSITVWAKCAGSAGLSAAIDWLSLKDLSLQKP